RDGTVEELHNTPEALQLLEQEHLVHILARQAIRGGDEDALHLGGRDRIPKRIQAGTAEGRGAGAVVTKHQALGRRPCSALLDPSAETVELLVNGLGVGLALARDAGIQSDRHGCPPVLTLAGSVPTGEPTAVRADTTGPSAAVRRGEEPAD